MSTFKIDFGAGFDVTESPDDEFNIELDLSEIAAGGELGGNMDAPTVDGTHAGSAHHAEDHATRHESGGADDLGGKNMAITGNWDVSGTTGRIKVQTGAGAPIHTEAEGTLYWDTTADKLYCNDDGSTSWTEIGSGGGAVQTPWAIWVPENVFDIGTAAWAYANRALFIPFTVLTTLTVTGIRVHIQVSSGNLDVGIYDESCTRLVSLGSTASPGTGGQLLDIADTELTPGRYYFAMVCDNTTINFARDISYSAVLGRWQYEDSAFPLPASVAAFDGFYNYATVAVLHISGGIG